MLGCAHYGSLIFGEGYLAHDVLEKIKGELDR
jgi:hypothetical protein